MNLLINLLIFISIFCSINAYFITIDAHAEECFFEEVEKDVKMGLTFEVAEGGFLDIDIKITGPNNKVIHEGGQEGSGKYTFAAYAPGRYIYCFSNQKSTVTPKVVMFNMDVNVPKPSSENDHNTDDGDDAANHRKLDDMISDLSKSLSSVKNEQEYMQVRDRNHRVINESTNFRVVLWSVFEASVLVCMTFGQILYLKRFFEVRRVV